MSGQITIVGLGSGDENQLSLGVWKKLQNAKRLYLRTAHHPVVALLDQNQTAYETFDSLYEAYDSFPEVYEAIAEKLTALAAADEEEIVYAVPGHPMMAESTVQLLKAKCKDHIALHIIGGESFLDQAFLRLGFDPIEGFQLLDGSQLDTAVLHPRLHTVIAQVYDSYTASEVKLGLMEVYPDDYEVVVGHALGVQGKEQIITIPLFELDRIQGYGNLSMVWVPRSDAEELQNRMFSRLREIVQILRSPEGCPWDREQTHSSIRKNLIEETYEVLETIDDDDPAAMCEELGDLLMQVMLHAQMEEETGTFTVHDVIAGLNAKLIRRHPHVFGDKQAGNTEEALENWQAIKDEEKRNKGLDPQQDSILSGVPRDLPGLMKALELQKRAAKVGFDWEQIGEVFTKIAEECQELQEVAELEGHEDQRKEELGDLLFAVVNASRFLGIDPESALEGTNRKFYRRFAFIENQLRLKGKNFEQTNLSEMETWWNEAKRLDPTKKTF
jgi:tetrapyrrole methylase family protein/MazG family protein